MKWLSAAAWILFALEVVFVVVLAVSRNVGDDAAGRGMATGFAIVLGPIVLIAGALLFWGGRSGPRAAFWAGLCMVASPVVFGAATFGKGLFDKFERSRGRALYGRFEDPRLTQMARAIDANDTTELRRLLAEPPTDFTARDRMDHTILGHAVYRVLEDWGGTERVEPVRVLLASGAPPAVDAMAPERTMRSVSEHNLVYHIYAIGHAGAAAVLDTVLGAGADPNPVDEDGRPIYFSTSARSACLEVLARHGTDFTRLDTREDRKGWTVLMQAVQYGSWDLALFFLEHGVPVDHTAPDGKNLRRILAEVDPPGTKYSGPEAAQHAAFLAALRR